MLADVHTPPRLSPEELDDYLAKGWFRAGRTIFTTNFLHFNGILYSALWLRLQLNNFELSKSQIKKNNAVNRFTFKIQPFELTEEKEELYADYKSGIAFSTASSLNQLLLDHQDITPFNTYEVAAFDNDRLIGLGVFDMGRRAAAGIVSFAHPDYKKYSLGAVIIYKKIQFSKAQGLELFYPGYFAPGYPAFDYKLNLGKNCTDFYDVRAEKWLPFHQFQDKNDLIQVVQGKAKQLMAELHRLEVDRELLIYKFYDLNLTLQFNGQDLLETPLIIPIRQQNKYQVDLLTYDILADKFQLLDCEIVYYLPNQEVIPGQYNKNILRRKRIIKEASEIENLFHRND